MLPRLRICDKAVAFIGVSISCQNKFLQAIKIFYLRIDIGKSLHVASLTDDKKNVIFKSFHFKNTTDDANLLLEKIALYPEIEIDSIIIADIIRYGKYSETSLMPEEILEIRNLSRFRISLVDSIGDLKRKIICVLDQLFPEYEY